MISSRDFQNRYEVFYDQMRQYLWSYDTLELLAQVEADIYSAFIDREKLASDFYKMSTSLKEVLKEDEDFQKAYDKLRELIDSEEESGFYQLNKVTEKNQEVNKVLRNPEDIKEEEKGEEELL